MSNGVWRIDGDGSRKEDGEFRKNRSEITAKTNGRVETGCSRVTSNTDGCEKRRGVEVNAPAFENNSIAGKMRENNAEFNLDVVGERSNGMKSSGVEEIDDEVKLINNNTIKLKDNEINLKNHEVNLNDGKVGEGRNESGAKNTLPQYCRSIAYIGEFVTLIVEKLKRFCL